MKTMTVAQARVEFAESLNQVAYSKDRIMITRSGKPIGVLVSLADLQLLQIVEEVIDQYDLAEARNALEEVRKKGTFSWEDVKKELAV